VLGAPSEGELELRDVSPAPAQAPLKLRSGQDADAAAQVARAIGSASRLC